MIKTYYHSLATILSEESKHAILKQCLTHRSYYADSNPNFEESKANSREIFLGMYLFKGKLAELLYTYVQGTGVQLQHYLGNIFKNEVLIKIYERYKLGQLCRYGSKFDIENQKVLMVYGFLGFIAQHSPEDKLKRFVYTNFLKDTDHLMPWSNLSKDPWAQCNYLCRMIFGEDASELHVRREKEVFEFTISCGDTVLASTKGVSFRYERKKALRLATKVLSEMLSEAYVQSPDYDINQARLLRIQNEKLAKEKALRIKTHQEKQRKKSEEARIKREKRKIEKQEKEETRLKQKRLSLKRKEQQRKQKEQKEQALKNLSVSKRRHLQDKGIIGKGKPE